MKNDGIDDILRMRTEHTELRAEAMKVIDERLSSLDDETAAGLIVTVEAQIKERLKAWEFLLETGYNYDYRNKEFLDDSAKAAYMHRDDFRAIRNEYEKMVVARNVFREVEQTTLADTSESGPKATYSTILKTIISEWEKLGVVIVYTDLGCMVEHEVFQRYDECASFHHQWLASCVSGFIRNNPEWRLIKRLRRHKQQWGVPEEVELVSGILEQIARLQPELRLPTDVDSLVGKISYAVERALRSVWETLPRSGGSTGTGSGHVFSRVEKALKWQRGLMSDLAKDLGCMNPGDVAEATRLIMERAKGLLPEAELHEFAVIFDKSVADARTEVSKERPRPSEPDSDEIVEGMHCPNPADLVETKEEARWLFEQARKAMSRAPREWAVFQLDVEGQKKKGEKPSLREIAERLGISEKAVGDCRSRYEKKLEDLEYPAA